MTTRAQAVDENMAVIMAMLESQQGKQEELLARTSELSEQQQKSQWQLAELQRLRQYVEGMGESLEARMEAAEKELATAVKVEPRPAEDSHTTGIAHIGIRI
jgi:chromosome segregation ATPase